MFETSFDEETPAERAQRLKEEEDRAAAEAVANAAPPAPTFSEEELQAARQSGFMEGRNAGLVEAQASLERRIADALDQVSRALAELSGDQSQAIHETMQNALEVTHAVLRKIVPDYVRRHGSDEVQSLVRQVVETLIDEPRIVIRVASDMVEPLRPRIEAAGKACSFEGQLVLFGDASLGESDCRLEWSSGAAERLTDEQWRAVDGIVSRALDRAPAEAPAAVGAAEPAAAPA
jgi:flagellar biosynthesis/type III secretory pathway protein FliH